MSTRALVAVPYGDSWRGRHTHTDGYPSGRGRDLWALVKREGSVERVRDVITHEHAGWSTINPNQPDIEGVTPPKSYDEAAEFGYGSPEYFAWMLNPGGVFGDGRFVSVPGWGIAYTTESGQISDDDWATPEDTWDSEWAYVLGDDAMHIFECHFGPESTPVATVYWHDEEPDWQAIEKGNEA